MGPTPEDIPDHVRRLQDQQLRNRPWFLPSAPAVAEIQAAEKAASEAAQESVKESRAAAAKIARDLDQALHQIRTVAQAQLDNFNHTANQRIAEAFLPPPPLAPIDLDPNYSEKDFASATNDSIQWVAAQFRNIITPHGFVFKVDYSRASSKPPTSLAMAIAEFYAAHPEKFEHLIRRISRPASKSLDPANSPLPTTKSPDDLEADRWIEILDSEINRLPEY